MLKAAEIFQDGMMLQREKKVIVWGKAKENETVEIIIQNQMKKAVADINGKWKIWLDPLKASYNEEMKISTDEEFILVRNIMIGEIWVAAGQSNMEFPMLHEKNYANEVKKSNKNLRFYDVPEVAFEGQRESFDYSNTGIWREADKMQLEYFSAVGYYFQKELEKELAVPVGVIGCNWGGTSCCAWMSAESVRQEGKPWMEFCEEAFQGYDMLKYWKNMKTHPANGRGNPCRSEFDRFILPATPSEDKIEKYMIEHKPDSAIEPIPPQFIPGALYENMVKELAPFTVRGILWYQGENEEMLGKQSLYEKMLTALIKDWRSVWEEQDLPFLLVQLPAWIRWLGMENKGFEITRRCQEKVADTVKNVWISSSSDQGEKFDIHPKDKSKIGYRSALLALGHIYGKKILCDAPRIKESEKKENKIKLSFYNAKGGLKLKGDKINGLYLRNNSEILEYEFEIADESINIFLEKDITGKINIEFAQEQWFCVNLYNEADLPVFPFKITI